MKKRLMAIALSLVMALSFLPVGAGAAEEGAELSGNGVLCAAVRLGR